MWTVGVAQAMPDDAQIDPRDTIEALRRELDARTAERDEALAERAAIAEVLQVIASSPGDLASVFDEILEKAHNLCGASRGTLFLFDGEAFRAAASQGYPGGPPERMRRGIAVTEDPRLAALLGGERLIHIPDLSRLDDPIALAVAKHGGVRTNLLLPLRKDGALLGVLSCNRPEVRPFSDKQIALLENFAAQAVIAMENARLITETREALEQQTATAEVLQVINSSPGDLAPVFDAILQQAHTLCGAQHGALVVYQDEHFRAVATHGLSSEFGEVYRRPFQPAPGSPQERLLRGEDFVHVPEFATRPADLIGGAAFDAGLRAVLMLPLRREGTLLGYIVASRPEPGPFSHKQIALLQNFAAQAVIAMENARLLTETREALEQQTATAEVLQVINSSPGDLGPVFDAILDKAHNLCGAELGALFTYDGECFWPVAAEGVSRRFTQLMQDGFHPGPGNPFCRRTRRRASCPYWRYQGSRCPKSGRPRTAGCRRDRPSYLPDRAAAQG